MNRRFLMAVAILALSGCDSSKSALIKVGDHVTFRKDGGEGAMNWLPVDELAFAEMGKPPAEFDKVFDQLVADGRIFQERNTARATVLETKNLGTKAAKLRITQGDHSGREAWTPFANLVRLPRS